MDYNTLNFILNCLRYMYRHLLVENRYHSLHIASNVTIPGTEIPANI